MLKLKHKLYKHKDLSMNRSSNKQAIITATCQQIKIIVLFLILSALAACASSGKKTTSTTAQERDDYRAITASSQSMYHFLLGNISSVHSREADLNKDKIATVNYYRQAAKHLSIAGEDLRSPNLLERAIKSAIIAEDYATAEKANAIYLANDNNNPRAYKFAAIIALAKKETELAVANLAQLVELIDNKQDAFKLAATMCADATFQPQGQAAMQQLTAVYQHQPQAKIANAFLLDKLGKQEQAQLQLKEIENIEEYKYALLLQAELAENSEDYRGAYAAIQKLRHNHPPTANTEQKHIEILIKLHLYSRAYAELEKVNQPTAPNMQATYTMMMLAFDLGRYADFKRHNRQLMLAGKYMQAAVFYRGLYQERLLNFSTAYMEYEKINSSRWLFEAKLRQSKILGLINSTAAGIEALNQLQKIQIKPDEAKQVRIGSAKINVYMENAQYQNANSLCAKLLQKFPENRQLLYLHALILDRMGDSQAAIAKLENLLQTYPQDADIENALGYTLLVAKQQLPRAAALIESAFSKRPDSAEVIDSIGWLRFNQGKLKQAEKYLARAHQRFKHPEIATHYATLLLSLKKRNLAKQVALPLYHYYPQHPELKNLIDTHNLKAHD